MDLHCFALFFFLETKSGASCPKLMTSLVNISFKFQMLISEIHQYFLLKKCEKLLQCKSAKASLIFSNKNSRVFGYSLKNLTVDLLTSSLN